MAFGWVMIMDKIWYIYVNGSKEGPYDVQNLKQHPKLTPDTLAWKQGFNQWVPIRSILELREIFKDEKGKEEEPNEEEIFPENVAKKTEDEVVALNYEPPSSYFWILVAVLIIFYTLYLLYQGYR